MMQRIVKVLGITSLIVTPVAAQFGIGGKRKKGTSFQDLNEMAREQGFGLGTADDMGDMAKMQDLMASAFNNPDMMEAFSSMGEEINKMMEELYKMDPDELQKQMEQALSMLTTGDMVETIVGKRDDILANLEATGLVPQEELEKFKEDPEYFEQQMRGAFDQMAGIFSDPETLKVAAETFMGISEAFNDPAILELTKLFEDGLTDDVAIEEARLRLLSDPELRGNPVLTALFGEGEFQDVLQDSKKWKDSVQEGQAVLKKQGGFAGLAGAGMGEL